MDQAPITYSFVENDDTAVVTLVNEEKQRWSQIDKHKENDNYFVIVSYGNISASNRFGKCKIPRIYSLTNEEATALANSELQSKISDGFSFGEVAVQSENN